MAPLSRIVHLGGMGVFAVLYGVVRTGLLFVVIALFFGLHLSRADFGRRCSSSPSRRSRSSASG